MSRPGEEAGATGETVVLRVTLNCGLRHARQDHERLLEAVDSFDAIEIDFDDPGLIDVSTLQLIISAEKSAAKRGKALALTRRAAEAVAAAAHRAGLLGGLAGGTAAGNRGGNGMEEAVP